MMYEAQEDLPGEDVRRGVTRVAPGHALLERFPHLWRRASDGPGADSVSRIHRGADCGVRGGSRPTRQRARPRNSAALAEEDRRRREVIAGFDAPEESTSGRERRVFWAGAEALLDGRKSQAERDREWAEARADAEHAEVVQALAKMARAEVDEACENWDDSAPWD